MPGRRVYARRGPPRLPSAPPRRAVAPLVALLLVAAAMTLLAPRPPLGLSGRDDVDVTRTRRNKMPSGSGVGHDNVWGTDLGTPTRNEDVADSSPGGDGGGFTWGVVDLAAPVTGCGYGGANVNQAFAETPSVPAKRLASSTTTAGCVADGVLRPHGSAAAGDDTARLRRRQGRAVQVDSFKTGYESAYGFSA